MAASALGFALWLFWPLSFAALRTGEPGPTRLMELRRAQAARRHLPYRISRQWVPLNRISPHLVRAVIAAEDDTFYRHAGIDWTAAWNSARHDLKRGRFARGGSTLTQQLVKNLYLTPRKSLLRKFKEAVLALRIERSLEKRRILELYLNVAEWGRGIFGAEAAARAYFGKSAAELTPDEAVALAAVLPSPLKHSPVREDRYLAWRRPWVWRQLAYAGYGPVTASAEPAAGEAGADEAAWDDAEEDDPGNETAPAREPAPDAPSAAVTPAAESLPAGDTPAAQTEP